MPKDVLTMGRENRAVMIDFKFSDCAGIREYFAAGRQHPAVRALLSLVSLFAIGYIDCITGIEINISVFYLVPIAFAAWFVGKRLGMVISICSAIIWLSCEFRWNVPYSNPIIPYWNAAAGLGLFMTVVVLLSKIKAQNEQLEENIAKRTATLSAEVKERKMAEEKSLILVQRLSLLEEQKRKQLSEELHDNIGQTLVLSKIKLSSLQQSAAGADISKELGEIKELIEQSIRFTRSLSFDLSSPILHKLGLISAIEWLCENFKEKYGLEVVFTHDKTLKQLNGETSILLFKTVQELLINVVKHANTGMAKITMARYGNCLKMEVKDDGVGLDTSNDYYIRKGSLGLFLIQERINYLRGKFEIDSEPNCGALCTVVVPL